MSFIKAYRVIDSCHTQQQLKTAMRYVELYIKRSEQASETPRQLFARLKFHNREICRLSLLFRQVTMLGQAADRKTTEILTRKLFTIKTLE
jgi:hypothetical protein